MLAALLLNPPIADAGRTVTPEGETRVLPVFAKSRTIEPFKETA